MSFLHFLILASSVSLSEQEALNQSKIHWEHYYDLDERRLEPTDFAKYCLSYIPKNLPLFEMGCGNGRDALFFLQNGIEVYATDLSETTIEKLQKKGSGVFFVSDFTHLGAELKGIPFGAIYSRFTMHSISAEAASSTYKWSYDALMPGGVLLLETRTIHDPFYGQGKEIAPDVFFTDHYRRFVRKEELVKELQSIGFTIIEAIESTGFAKHNNEDPSVLRIIAKK